MAVRKAIAANDCVYLAAKPEDYIHGSAAFYINNKQGIFEVTSFMELQDIDLTLPR